MVSKLATSLVLCAASSFVFAQASPEGASIARIKAWKFPCKEAGEYTLEVRNPTGVEVTAKTRPVMQSGGVCSFPVDWYDSGRLTRGYLPLDVKYSWRVRDKNNAWSEPVSFEVKPVIDHNFARMPKMASDNEANWKIENGWLVTELSKGSTRIASDYDRKQLPGEPREVSRALSAGGDYLWRLESICPDQNCQVGFVFSASPWNCGGTTCYRQSWYELRVRSGGSPQLVRVVREGSQQHEYLLRELADTYVDLSYPQNIRIVHHLGNAFIALTDGQRVCVPLPQPADEGVNAGVVWTSNEDDAGMNKLRIDRLVTAATVSPVTCGAPLPDL